jgi:FMN phosphatase YigB (HAD superfamily)
MGGFADIAADLLAHYYGIAPSVGRRRYLETSGIPFFQQLEIIRPNGEHNSDCARDFEARKLDGFFDAAPSSQTIRGLESLRQQGLRLVVSSNNFQDNVEKYLTRHPMPLDLVLGFDKQGMEKGRPHFERVRNILGIEFGEMLFCGDSLEDGVRALGAGLRFIGMTGTFTSEQFRSQFKGVETVDSIEELARKLQAMQPT